MTNSNIDHIITRHDYIEDVILNLLETRTTVRQWTECHGGTSIGTYREPMEDADYPETISLDVTDIVRHGGTIPYSNSRLRAIAPRGEWELVFSYALGSLTTADGRSIARYTIRTE
jgi:hypothetical protein